MTLLLLCPCMSLSLSFPKCDYINTPKKNKPHTKLTPSKNSCKFAILGGAHFAFRSRNGKFDGFSVKNNSSQSEHETLELLTKPSLVPLTNGSSSEFEVDKEKALEPFLKFFKGSESDSLEVKGDGGVWEDSEEMGHKGGGDGENEEEEEEEEEEEANEKVSAIGEYYYEPKPGDFVVGVVVAGNENRLSVNVGAELLGTMLTKEVLPLYGKELEHLFCGGDGNNNNNKEEEDFMVQGRMGIAMRNDDDGDAMNGGMVVPAEEGSSSVVEIGTVLFAEVLGRTLTGRPLLSSRRLFRRIGWHRLRQIKQRKEPIKVRITEWNTKGLLTRIEGLRAFLPKAELVKRVHSFTELKENVGRYMYVQITEVDEAKNNLILSEKEAWEKLYLQEGTLLEGTVKKILPYGAQIRIGETNRRLIRYKSHAKVLKQGMTKEMERHPNSTSIGNTNEGNDLVRRMTMMLENVQPPEDSVVPEQCIYRVPHKIRLINPKAFTPNLVSINPIHNPFREYGTDRRRLKPMEELKLQYLKGFLNHTQLSVSDCLSRLKDLEVKMRRRYAEPVELNSDDFLKMVLIDACFIIEHFLTY